MFFHVICNEINQIVITECKQGEVWELKIPEILEFYKKYFVAKKMQLHRHWIFWAELKKLNQLLALNLKNC